ncbi:MAG: chloride channel protein [Anaerolineales bacterium]|nr:chloride channel protein [Anaerolineales bacterium]MCL4259645.1 chloride channel protein [Anaerolineales bacterium]
MDAAKIKNEARLADFTTDKRVLVLSGMAVIIGAAGSLVAYALVWLINLFTNLAYYQRLSAQPASPEGNHMGIWAVLVPVVGGLIIGLMARYGSEKIRGHGIPEALEAILIGGSRMEPKVAVLKPISSAISIGTGGPFGAEGPIIMTGGAVGSLFAQFFQLTAAERKTLLVAGAAAGMAAIFAAPVAAVLLAVELLLFEWKPRSFIPVALAAAVAGAVRVGILGEGPIFPIAPHAALGGSALLIACLIGVAAGLASGMLTMLVYFFEDLFERLPIHWMWWPIFGGLAIGVGGLIDPRVLGVGYDIIHQLLRGELIGAAVLGLLIVKALVWSIALGSGTSGGVLAPLLIMGGALGAFLSQWIPYGDAGLWALIGMSAIMGGTMRSPLTSMIFVLELTHDLNVLPGLLFACILADAVTILLLKRSILTEKVARRGHHLSREYSVDPFELTRVSEVMDKNPVTIPAAATVAEFSARIAHGDPQVAWRQGTPIVDAKGALVGILTRNDIVRALETDPAGNLTVLEAGSGNLIVAFPDEPLKDAVSRMLRHDIGRLPVVSRNDQRQLLGYLGRTGLLEARFRNIREEEQRERRWDVTGKGK